MMWIVIAMAVASAAAIVVLQIYLRDSAVNHRLALKFWPEVESSALKVISGDFSPEVRRLAMGLVMTTGCGCYVRSLLIERWIPKLHHRRVEASRMRGAGAGENPFKGMAPQQKRQFDELLARAIAFDLLTNPFWGGLLRMAMRKRFQNTPSQTPAPVPSPSRAERDAVIRVAARKQPELCTA